ncbi:MAG: NADH-quinone oxidoreductase subunit L [Bacteroidetes bacterium]|nr:NADH-quinone oxidoreductase subunit L [Bacteroidota bacterium]
MANSFSSLVYWVPLLPLIGFLINGLCRNYLSKSLTGIIGSGVILISFILSVLIFNETRAESDALIVKLFDFINTNDLKIPFAFQVDRLSALFLLIITGVGFLIHLYSTAYMHEESDVHFARYFAYLNLFVFNMLLLVLGANYLIMFIGWEGVGLCSYLLIGYWFKNVDYGAAARKAFVMNRIGDLGFLLGLFFLLQQFGTLNYVSIMPAATGASVAVLTTITLLLFVGATGKSAQIPLYTWLPDAMAGPTPVSALIHAATMVTAGIYMIARSNILYTLSPVTQTVVTVIGLATALLAATIALKQNDIKKVLAYSTVSQLGYMFVGLGVGAYTGAVFHVMTHAFFKALLFLGAGSVIHAMHHEQDIRKMGGLAKKLPHTHWTFLVGCIAIAGIPPFSGFFSKDEILIGAYNVSPILYWIGLLGALMTAFYMFRLYATTFRGSFRGTHEQEHHLHESPLSMVLPLIVLALLAIVSGFIGIPELFAKDAHWLQKYLAPVFAQSNELAHAHHITHETEYILLGVSITLILVVVVYAWKRFASKPDLSEPSGFGKLLSNKWYVDELYAAIISKPLEQLSSFTLKFVEKKSIDGAVNGTGKLVQWSARQIRFWQSGQVGNYILWMVVGLVAVIVLMTTIFS